MYYRWCVSNTFKKTSMPHLIAVITISYNGRRRPLIIILIMIETFFVANRGDNWMNKLLFPMLLPQWVAVGKRIRPRNAKKNQQKKSKTDRQIRLASEEFHGGHICPPSLRITRIFLISCCFCLWVCLDIRHSKRVVLSRLCKSASACP